jgi:hypothetical protein
MALNSPWRSEKAVISVGHTKVKLKGAEGRQTEQQAEGEGMLQMGGPAGQRGDVRRHNCAGVLPAECSVLAAVL